MFHIPNLEIDITTNTLEKDGFEYKFQGRFFKPCSGLTHHLRWGEYMFDVREMREFLQLPEEPDNMMYNFKLDKEIFLFKVMAIIKAVGDRNFIKVGEELNEYLTKEPDISFEELAQMSIKTKDPMEMDCLFEKLALFAAMRSLPQIHNSLIQLRIKSCSAKY